MRESTRIYDLFLYPPPLSLPSPPNNVWPTLLLSLSLYLNLYLSLPRQPDIWLKLTEYEEEYEEEKENDISFSSSSLRT